MFQAENKPNDPWEEREKININWSEYIIKVDWASHPAEVDKTLMVTSMLGQHQPHISKEAVTVKIDPFGLPLTAVEHFAFD